MIILFLYIMNKIAIIAIIAIIISIGVIGTLVVSSTSEPEMNSEPTEVMPKSTGRDLSVSLEESISLKSGP